MSKATTAYNAISFNDHPLTWDLGPLSSFSRIDYEFILIHQTDLDLVDILPWREALAKVGMSPLEVEWYGFKNHMVDQCP